jgi:DNA-directed RNA polymerase specialized sigma24 family protein
MSSNQPDPGREGSVTRMIPALQRGEQQAVQALWERYFEPMVRVAEARLRGAPCRAGGAEDVAVDAFLRFCADVQEKGRFPDLSSRDNLLRLLFWFTVCEAGDFRKRETRRHRVVRGDSALGEARFELHAGREPPPEGQAQLASLLAKLPDDKKKLRSMALLRLEGLSNDEIAAACKLSRATVERRFDMLRGCLRADWEALQGNSEEDPPT